MQRFVLILSVIATATIILNIGEAEARGYRHRDHPAHKRHHRYRVLSASESDEGLFFSSSSESREYYRPKSYGGRGWMDSLKDAAKDLGSKAYQKAKDTDWKEVGKTGYDKAKKVAAAAQSRKKRSFETYPLPVEQLITEPENLEDQGRAKSLYNKRSVKKERKSFFDSKNTI